MGDTHMYCCNNAIICKVNMSNLFILGNVVFPSFSDGQATGMAGTSLAHNQAEVASVA